MTIQEKHQILELTETEQTLRAVVSRYIKWSPVNEDRQKDLLQDLKLKAFQALDAYDGSVPIGPYLWMVGERHAQTILKRYWRESAQIPEGMEQADPAVSVQEWEARETLRGLLAQALPRLGPAQRAMARQILSLIQAGQLPSNQCDLAAVLGVSHQTLGVLISKLKKLNTDFPI